MSPSLLPFAAGCWNEGAGWFVAGHDRRLPAMKAAYYLQCGLTPLLLSLHPSWALCAPACTHLTILCMHKRCDISQPQQKLKRMST
jgi:hypothetical protein